MESMKKALKNNIGLISQDQMNKTEFFGILKAFLLSNEICETLRTQKMFPTILALNLL